MEALRNQLKDYDFNLPRDLIAQQPLGNRSDARMLVVDRSAGTLSHFHVRDLPDLVQPGDCLVVNDSRVIPARLLGFRSQTGGRWEGLFLRSDEEGLWEVLGKTRGTMAAGETITLRDSDGRESLKLVFCAKLPSGNLVVRPEPNIPFEEALEKVGRVPLPPYIRDGQMVPEDTDTYQTVYARKPGSVAAPTAGLHFTPDLLQKIKKAGAAIGAVTLHVGLGTFRPIKSDNLDDHTMHSEVGEITENVAAKLQAAREAGSRVIAVGTTTTRILETASQATGKIVAWKGDTDIFIKPPYKFRAIDGLLTNFHLPQSTLIVLVATLAGYDLTMQAYEEAIRERYRFYSYGDCMLII